MEPLFRFAVTRGTGPSEWTVTVKSNFRDALEDDFRVVLIKELKYLLEPRLEATTNAAIRIITKQKAKIIKEAQEERLHNQELWADLQQNPLLQVRILKGIAILASEPDPKYSRDICVRVAADYAFNVLVSRDDEFKQQYNSLLLYTKDEPVFPITQNDLNMIQAVFGQVGKLDKPLMIKLIDRMIIPWYEGEDVVALKLAFDP